MAGLVRTALLTGAELFELIAPEYRDAQLALASLVERTSSGETLDRDEQAQIEAATGMSLEDIRAAAGLPEPGDDEEPDDDRSGGSEEPEDPTRPTILVTTLLGAKGLQAEHVFVLGLK